MKVVVIGSANMDMVMRTSRIPEVGETIQGERFFLTAGGKGANQAVAAAKMSAETYFMGKVGNDIFGKSLIKNIGDYGVKTDYVGIENGVTTGVATITVCNGNNSIIIDGGANDHVSPAFVTEHKELLLSASVIMLQLEVPVETVYEVIKMVKGKVPIFLNPAPAIPLEDEMLQGIDYFTPNEKEVCLYTGVTVNTIDDAFNALEILRGKDIRFPVVTLGEDGVAYFNGMKNVYKSGRNVIATDTTAAGDTFSGTLAAMISSGKTIDEAVDIAQIASSISVTREGAQTSIPTLQEVLEVAGK